MSNKKLLLVLSATALAVLAACGGGGGASTGPSATAASVTIQTYITDNLATEYSKVWVSIKKLSAVDGAGKEVTLFDSTATPVVVNLSSLAAVGQFMSTVTIPAGIYTQINVTLGNEVQLVSLDGKVTTNAKFSATGGDFVWKVKQVEMDATTSGQVVLDFNLSKFTYDAATGIVTPTLELPKPADAFKKFVRQQAEVEGVVVSVDTAKNSLTIDDPHLGKGIIISLAADAVITNEKTGSVMSLADLPAGARIEVKGVVTPGATTADPVTVVATVIHVESLNSGDALAPPMVNGEGKVSEVAGKLVTVTLSEANFLPGSDAVVVDISNARLIHGQASDIAVGVKVEFRGTISGTGAAAMVLAKTFDIEGAESEKERHEHPEQKFSMLNGSVATVNADGTFTVKVTKPDNKFVAAGEYTVDPSKAMYAGGNASCLIPNANVNALGALTDKTLLAKVIEIKDCSGQKRAEPPKMGG